MTVAQSLDAAGGLSSSPRNASVSSRATVACRLQTGVDPPIVDSAQNDPYSQLVDYAEYERSVGYVRARLRVVAADAGGPPDGVCDDYRPNWGVGERLSGDALIAAAPITIEGADRIPPGESGFIRLHPIHWDAWAVVRPGDRVPMLAGSRIVGVAEVVEVVRRA